MSIPIFLLANVITVKCTLTRTACFKSIQVRLLHSTMSALTQTLPKNTNMTVETDLFSVSFDIQRLCVRPNHTLAQPTKLVHLCTIIT